ncbi:MAG: hypothetical protein AB8H47_04625 [Bacteroidia bacterium]
MQKSTYLGSLLFLLVYCFTPAVNAQSFRDLATPFTYLQLPLEPLEGTFKTYSIRVDDMELDPIEYGVNLDELLPKTYKLTAYEMIPVKGDFEVIIELGKAYYIGKTLAKGKERVKNKAGENVDKVYYYYDLTYALPFKVSVYDGKRQLMREKTFNKRGEERVRTYGKASRATQLATSWEAEQEKYIYETFKRELNRLMQVSGDWLQANIDTRYVTLRDIDLLTIKKPEKFGAEKLVAALQQIESMQAADKFKRSPEEVLKELQGSLDVFKTSLKEFDPKNKKQIRLHYAAALALAKMYTYLHEPGQGKTYFEMAQASTDGYRSEALVKDFIPVLKDMERRVAANQSIAQTYAGTYEETAASDFLAAYEKERETEISTFTETGEAEEIVDANAYLITTEKDTIKGQIEYDWNDKKGITRFYVFETGNREETEQKVDPTKVLLVHRNGINYGMLDFLPSYDVILPIRAMAEIIFTGKKVSYFIFEYPDKSDHDYLVYNAETKKLNNLNGDRFGYNFNKAFAKYLADCPTVSKLAAEGEYEQNRESLLTALKAYNECE